jgi:hypothetical protein
VQGVAVDRVLVPHRPRRQVGPPRGVRRISEGHARIGTTPRPALRGWDGPGQPGLDFRLRANGEHLARGHDGRREGVTPGGTEPMVGYLFGHLYFERARREKGRALRPRCEKELWLGRSAHSSWTPSDQVSRVGRQVPCLSRAARHPRSPLLLQALPESRMILLVRDPQRRHLLEDGRSQGGAVWCEKAQKGRGQQKHTHLRGRQSRTAFVKSQAKRYDRGSWSGAQEPRRPRRTEGPGRYEDLVADTPGSICAGSTATLGIPAEEAEHRPRGREARLGEHPAGRRGGRQVFYRKGRRRGGWTERPDAPTRRDGRKHNRARPRPYYPGERQPPG